MRPNKNEDSDLQLKSEGTQPAKTSWWKYALTAGVISASGFLLVSYIPTEYLLLRIALVIGFFVFVLVMIKNPLNRYMNGFYIVLFMITITNGLPFVGGLFFKSEVMEFQITPNTPDFKINLCMVVICIVLLFLDYKERNPTQQSSPYEKKKTGPTYNDKSTHNGDNNF